MSRSIWPTADEPAFPPGTLWPRRGRFVIHGVLMPALSAAASGGGSLLLEIPAGPPRSVIQAFQSAPVGGANNLMGLERGQLPSTDLY